MWILPNFLKTGWREREERNGDQEEEENKNPVAKKQNKNNRKSQNKFRCFDAAHFKTCQ